MTVEQQAPPEVASGTPAKPSPDERAEGISAFLARVFDQLSLTAWLPAVFFVGNAAVLLGLQGDAQLDLGTTIQDLAELEWGAIIVLLFAVIISAMVIQAFEFENLRLWEGYLRWHRLEGWTKRRIRSFQSRLSALDQRSAQQQQAAFDDARRRALDQASTTIEQRAMWNVMEKVIHGRELAEGEDVIADRAAVELGWPEYADPVLLHAWTITDLKLAELPEAHRLMPTRLGNVMRSAEDQVSLASDEDLEGFMIRHLDELPPTIISEHGSFRRRLEMYCALMFVLAALAVLSAACLWGFTEDLAWRLAIPTLYAVAVWVSYKAAVASALGFGQALKEADSWVRKHAASVEVPTSNPT